MAHQLLSDDDRMLLSARADEFHAALANGAVTDWDKYVAGVPERARRAVLAELVIIDLGFRWPRGERPRVEEYVARFPELGPIDRVPAAVVLEEHRCRVKAGEPADPNGFRARFPAQYPEVAGEIEAGRAGTVSGTLVVSTIASADGGAAIAQSHAPGGGSSSEYDFIKILGRGVFGEVWQAQKKGSGIEKAVKILMQAADHEAAHRERRALELIKNLRHPYLLSTDDFWVTDNRLHVAMELADGTLRDQLKRSKEVGEPGVPPAQLLGYMWEAAEGLDFLHSRHVIHRDIKPDNILLLHGHAKVGDFGLARYQEEVLAPMRTFAGTPAYMAPEVWGREGGPASDQYSLAIAYAELRQGTPPLKPRPIQQMLLAHSAGEFEFADFIGADERAVVLRALAQKAEDRYPSCRAFVEALCTVLGHAGVPRAPVSYAPAAGFDRDLSSVPTERDSVLAAAAPTRADTADAAAAAGPRPRPLWHVAAIGLVVMTVATTAGAAIWQAIAHHGGAANRDGGPRADDGPGPQPGSTEPWFPPNTTPVPGHPPVKLSSGAAAAQWVEKKLGPEAVRFRLIPAAGSGPTAVAPFYAMESKVWNGLYRAAGADPSDRSNANGPDAPVTFVTWDEARAFAEKIGGTLPHPDQWDHAAGLYAVAGRDTVALPGATPHVARPAPGPARGAKGPHPDENEFGLRDMAGNGREWTARVGSDPDGRRWAVTRGRSFTSKSPLTFADLREQLPAPMRQYTDAPSPYTGFRVVLPGPG
ncbi:serine threonine protein kinase : Putative serine/threonine protein kinase OS=Gemmata sp. Wa1-1 PE=3 SV=1: Pkinase: FGE-sulfatase [Gemmataceae bacterium]|nr:serine threonine protein kinase : Putative serine/threonine protein kinase OS=Gemmata sp. Wa1-1 PE=3 SV=1: Pkinase: FGE-sulfatase [Gemmataceae bacterium]VTT99219.1 serine threonine protein kinase : Putative serine/threonine protein kinase OS=Gemmata sp. Wa1-1 PE=3 SV=1: Pkinase: FGE-sulfatase [Gemmataceae bacterium]